MTKKNTYCKNVFINFNFKTFMMYIKSLYFGQTGGS